MPGEKPITPRLSQLATPWTAVGRAQGDDENCRAAQADVLSRYRPALLRYLGRLVRNDDLAEELAQEFALRFIRGDFRNVRPERGRFRDYLKAAIRNLVSDHFQKKRLPLDAMPSDSQIPGGESLLPPSDDDFNEIWKRELILRAWTALREDSKRYDNLYYEALRLKADGPRRTADELAAILSERAGKPINAALMRQLQHRAREKFAGFLRRAVEESLPTGDSGNVDDELAELGLLIYMPSGK